MITFRFSVLDVKRTACIRQLGAALHQPLRLQHSLIRRQTPVGGAPSIFEDRCHDRVKICDVAIPETGERAEIERRVRQWSHVADDRADDHLAFGVDSGAADLGEGYSFDGQLEAGVRLDDGELWVGRRSSDGLPAVESFVRLTGRELDEEVVESAVYDQLRRRRGIRSTHRLHWVESILVAPGYPRRAAL